MMIPEILLDTSIISLALFVWAVVIKFANSNTAAAAAATAPQTQLSSELSSESNFSAATHDKNYNKSGVKTASNKEAEPPPLSTANLASPAKSGNLAEAVESLVHFDDHSKAVERSKKELKFYSGGVKIDDQGTLRVCDEYDDGGIEEEEGGEGEPLVDSSQCGDSKDGTPLSSTPGSPKQSSGLSRRQKKNRKKVRKKQSVTTPPVLSRTSSEELRTENIVSSKNIVPSKQYIKLNQPDQEIYKMLTVYTLTQNQTRQIGFPMQSSLYPGKAYIYRDPELINSEVSCVLLDATAEEFVPSSSLTGAKKPLTAVNSSPTINIHSEKPQPPPVSLPNASPTLQNASSSPNLLQDTRTSVEGGEDVSMISITPQTAQDRLESGLEMRRCVRCYKSFWSGTQNSAQYYSEEPCTYHWGKLRSDLQQYGDIYQTYQCCGAQLKSRGKGCSTAKLHVWSGFPINGGIFGPLEGFTKTKTTKAAAKEHRYTVYALDCEMCYTIVGLELTKVSVVGLDGRLVYESLVNTENEIIDFNTRFSGITAKDLNTRSTKSLKEVQQDLNGFISADSILIGHGLENDLRALKLIHDQVIDTSLVFPHFYGLPYRRSLRSLARSYLKREIQGNVFGHDSYEDARASIELMLWKVRKDLEKSSQHQV